VSVIAILAAVLGMGAKLHKRDRQLKQILTMLEAKHKAEAELDAMRAVLAPCPVRRAATRPTMPARQGTDGDRKIV